ncbi:DUF4157 domain-containing protein [Rubritalea spongiae]|uniref:DUF4157 domain-containing protein n=1 Tax=Rubritalea spongiae TaxID=430797 RepID=A0ABW5E5N2_9BACT
MSEPYQKHARTAASESIQLSAHPSAVLENFGITDQRTAQLQALTDNRSVATQAAVAQKQSAPNQTGMPDKLKSGIESLSGHDMSDVRVHYNSSKPAQLNAHAYAQGTQIHIAPGQEKHLPHEAWHTVQQKQNRVKPTLHSNGAVINDSPSLEREADIMGAKAINHS